MCWLEGRAPRLPNLALLTPCSVVLSATVMVLWASPAHAYIGPGAGLGLLGALAAMMAVISTSLGVIVTGPIRRWLARRRRPHVHEGDAAANWTAGQSEQDRLAEADHLDDEHSSTAPPSGH
ncbi:MAG TPA: hypothetical protein DCQ06_09150 [Myxococcales bacterium]|nr:hypothetical protein [Myxococcales bacterium]